MLSRATSIPAATISARRSGLEEAGPSVHTILALRTLMTIAKLCERRETNQPLVLPRTDDVQCVLKIRWIRRFELHRLARRRVHETKADGVQPLPFQAELGSQNWVGPIHRIADAGMSNRCHVYPDLMGSAGFQLDLEQSCCDKSFQGRVVGDAVPAFVHHRHLVIRAMMPSDRSLDGASERIRMALPQRVVDLVNAPRAECSFEDRVRMLALRDHHQPGGPDVQALHDAAPLRNPGG